MKYVIAQSEAVVNEDELKESYQIEADQADWENYEDWKQDMIECGLLVELPEVTS